MDPIVPHFTQQTDSEPLLCPICQHEILPAESSESDDPDAIKPCEHVVLMQPWGYEQDDVDPAIRKWWDSVSAKREQLEEARESQEVIYRECPLLEYLVEHVTAGAGPMPEFVASFGFRTK